MERIIGGILGFDMVLILLNPWLNHCFSIEQVVLKDGNPYYKYVSLWYHYIHLGISYLLVAACTVLVMVKIVRTAMLYREKYIVIEFSLLTVAVWEMVYVLSPSALEYSMIGYVATAILVYFFSLEYKPYIATYRMQKEVLANISEAIMFFDEKNNCIFANERARAMILKKEDQLEKAWGDAMKIISGGVYDEEDVVKEGFFQCVRSYQVGDDKRVFEIEYQRVDDRRGFYVGAFITAKDRTEEQKRLDKERYQATHDSLTGLYNVDHLYDVIEKRLIETPEQRYVVVVSDIKGFKMVNDIYGTKTGDEILINIAKQIQEYARKSTLYGRIGSDKFGLIMKRESFREELFLADVKRFTHADVDMFYPIIIHVGVYEVTDRRIPVSVMFDRAFMALATIKNDMQKRVAYYDSNLREDLLWEQRISGSIDAGLDAEQILPYLQAQVSADGTIQGAEMLARWMHPTEGFLKPRRFLPTLEKNGYVVRLDQFMWERACQILKRWEERGWEHLYLSVNISPVDFFFTDVVEEITSIVNRYEIEPQRLRLEITENAMMYDANRRIEVIDKLREKGFIVEMDDFGSGFSSLNMLKDMPIDVMKLDMSFLEKTKNIERAKQILESIIALAKNLKIPVITEGVETKEQLDYLSGMGCDMFQGYYFAKAVPIEEFEDRYMRKADGRIIVDNDK